jgi:hypothetical protein
MRRAVVPAVLAALSTAACGGARAPAEAPDPCARAGFSGGTTAADGAFFAVIPRGCARGHRQECTVGDATGPIDREVVDAGVEQSCVAFNQFVGSGLSQVPGYVTGECFGRATVAVAGVLVRRTRFAPRRCLLRGGRSGAVGPPPPPLDRAVAGTSTVEGRVPDPWGRAPESGSVGGPPLKPPPWALVVWRARSGATCYEPGQVVGHDTPGRSDELPGIRPTGPGLTQTLVGALRYDSKSGTGIQLYGLGRFERYPVEETGSCGFPARGAGLLLSRESQYPRRDLSLGHTIVAGIAGPRVTAVAIEVAGRRRALRLSRRRGFLWVLRGVVSPRRVAVVVRYADGRVRTFAG